MGDYPTFQQSSTSVKLVPIGGKFWYKGSYHKVIMKTKTNVQSKNIRTGKTVHILNDVNVDF